LASAFVSPSNVGSDTPVHQGKQEHFMAKGYWIVRVDITDQEQYKTYVAANAAPLKKYGARFLVRGGRFENPEGASRTRNAVIEFPSYQAAVDCWKSPEYQHAITLRQPVSTADLIIIEGYEGPQPG
jgi:uncharacterized protein (DUF1330 family)